MQFLAQLVNYAIVHVFSPTQNFLFFYCFVPTPKFKKNNSLAISIDTHTHSM